MENCKINLKVRISSHHLLNEEESGYCTLRNANHKVWVILQRNVPKVFDNDLKQLHDQNPWFEMEVI